jgi:hypothetical protein
MPHWSVEEAAALLIGLNPRHVSRHGVLDYDADGNESPYQSILELSKRAYGTGRIGSGSPREWIDWAKAIDLPVPAKLRDGVERWGASKVVLAPSIYARGITYVAEPADTGAAKTEKLELDPRERASLLKLVIGMAMAGYRYDPKAKRNDAVTEIYSDLLGLGIELSDDTIRRFLREAAQYAPPEASE